MKKIFLILLMNIYTNIYSIPVTYTITYNATTSVTCAIGDTLKLYGTYSGDYVASTKSGTTTVANIFPTMVSAAPFYVGYFLITGTETSFFFSEISQGPSTGTINVLISTNLIEHKSDDLIKFFPNPFNDKITIVVNKANTINLFSSTGSLISLIPLQNGETVIDLTKYPNGLYFLRDENKIYRILKE